jgi:hypothetical protein
MSDSNRRGFLKVAGVGATAVGAAAVATPRAAQAAGAEAPRASDLPASAKPEMLVHVRDVHTGAISLMVEGQEVTVHDRDLAARIATVLHVARSGS